MTDGTGWADPRAEATKEKSGTTTKKGDDEWEKAKARLAEKFKHAKAVQKEEMTPALPTTNEQQVTLGQVVDWVGKGSIKGIPYTIKNDGEGAGAQIWLGDAMVGSVKAGIVPLKSVGQKLAGGVETINVNNQYQRRGLGVVLAIAFYVRSEGGNAEYVYLSTNDTSGGFWGNLGMGNRPIGIEAAKAKVRSFTIRW